MKTDKKNWYSNKRERERERECQKIEIDRKKLYKFYLNVSFPSRNDEKKFVSETICIIIYSRCNCSTDLI